MPEESLQSLSKKELIELAQPHCEASFTAPSESGKFYTAWNSMTTLVNKDLVQEKGRPLRKYALTEDGWEVAKRIRAVEAGVTGDEATGKRSKGPEVSGMPKNIIQAGEDVDRFVDLEDYMEEEEPFRPTRMTPTSTKNAEQPQPTSSPSGQRLGGAPTDKYGTFSKARSRASPVVPKKNVVELLSSPEPEIAPNKPGTSSRIDQDTRSLTSKPASKPLQQTSYPPQSSLPQATTKISRPPVRSSDNPSFLPTFDPIRLAPGCFTIHLVLDNREVRTKDDRDYIADELTKKGY